MTNLLRLPSDWSMIKRLIWLKAHPAMRDSGVEQTVSGSAPLAFSHAKTTPMEHLITNIKPVQDLHGYDNPWPAGGGKNKLKHSFIQGSAIALNQWNRIVSDTAIPVVEGNTYTFSSDNYTDYYYVINTNPNSTLPISGSYDYCGNNTWWVNHDITFTATNSGYMWVVIHRNVDADSIVPSDVANVKMQVEIGSTATTFAPYENLCPIHGWKTITAWDDAKYGGLVEWNQILRPLNTIYWNVISGTTGTIENGEAVVTELTSTWKGIMTANVTVYATHKYLLMLDARTLNAGESVVISTGILRPYPSLNVTSNTYARYSAIVTTLDDLTSTTMTIANRNNTNPFAVKNIQLFDLTAMFGAGNEPATVEEFRALFPKDYYPYNAGTHTSVGEVNGSGYWKVPVTFGALSANQWDEVNIQDGYISDVDGEVKSSAPYKSTGYVEVLPSASYYVCTEQTNGAWGAWYDADKRFITGVTGYIQGVQPVITSPSNAKYVRLTLATYDGGNPDTFAINYPSTVTTYNPYTDTIYGGTLDLATGDGTITLSKIILDGTQTGISVNWRSSETSVGVLFPYSLTNNKISMSDTEIPYLLAETTPPTAYRELYNKSVDSGIGIVTNLSTWGLVIRLPDPTLTTDELVNQYLAEHPITVVYELATPIPFHIDGLSIKPLKGDNNVWTDCGDTLSATYTVNAPVKTLEVTGDPPLSLPYSVGKPLKAWEVDVLPYQEGTGDPAPDNVRPIHGTDKLTVCTSGKVLTGINGLITENSGYSIALTNLPIASKIISMVNALPEGNYNFGVECANLGSDYTRTIRINYTDGTRVDFFVRTGTDGWCVDTVTIPHGVADKTIQSIYAYFGRDGADDPINASYSNLKITTSDVTPLETDEYTAPSQTVIDVPPLSANQWDEEWENGGISGQTGQKIPQSNVIRSANYIPVQPNTEYYVFNGYTASGNQMYVWYYNAEKAMISNTGSYIGNSAITTPNNCRYIMFQCNSTYGKTYNNNISINYPSTVTTYNPYNATVYTGTIGSEGGESRWGEVDLGTLSWTISNPGKFYANIPNKQHDSITCDVMSSIYKSLENNGTNAGVLNIMDDMSVTGFYNPQSTNSWVYVHDSRFSALNNFIQAVTGAQLVYQLATPTEYAVSTPTIPTPTGTATTWATAEDGTVDSMEVTYKGHVMPE